MIPAWLADAVRFDRAAMDDEEDTGEVTALDALHCLADRGLVDIGDVGRAAIDSDDEAAALAALIALDPQEPARAPSPATMEAGRQELARQLADARAAAALDISSGAIALRGPNRDWTDDGESMYGRAGLSDFAGTAGCAGPRQRTRAELADERAAQARAADRDAKESAARKLERPMPEQVFHPCEFPGLTGLAHGMYVWRDGVPVGPFATPKLARRESRRA